MTSLVNKPIIVALDYANEKDALNFVSQCDPNLCRLKVGKELFTSTGPQLVKKIIAQGFDVFLDLKFHDIPNTVASACRAAADLGVWMLNVHASGGKSMMEKAQHALSEYGKNKPKLIAVTVLTSMSQLDLEQIGINYSLDQHVLRLASLTQSAGLDGVVCSAQETRLLRSQLGDNFLLVTPGIRLDSNKSDDQVRIVTPQNAVANGSNYLVIGRPITQSADPIATLLSINTSLQLLQS
ncbi:orotidine-5'-phosphate decarboxylase [Ferrovum sp. PN-J185]|uniref:orotidine-5'-phosphate decarboxylase n=1 Tax=Ferrovum sp. PN-J185 TaxID=1356306 RepID=UPI0007986DB2|nr:orotidine-5'-phosphate decarboxylase [Ferrovum sp. PN-J185]KXW56867.1 orotidine 5'-phosphate decarboxylase [Ferrovum sp. PN-J185]MCC6069265.1 orotidine-5'-phosphate decarboxylase [Ferrovum sp. PN-J185]MDE1891435.1 orotidine-5'-phosphate decarboxylase [Betaproteobacteria bacterium]MDE2056039.1 orotidine-5'-phosphate decarboxylase [Betaproteobacteria bacterium]